MLVDFRGWTWRIGGRPPESLKRPRPSPGGSWAALPTGLFPAISERRRLAARGVRKKRFPYLADTARPRCDGASGASQRIGFCPRMEGERREDSPVPVGYGYPGK